MIMIESDDGQEHQQEDIGLLALSFMLLFLGAERTSLLILQLAGLFPRSRKVANLTEIELTFSSGLINDGNAKFFSRRYMMGKKYRLATQYLFRITSFVLMFQQILNQDNI